MVANARIASVTPPSADSGGSARSLPTAAMTRLACAEMAASAVLPTACGTALGKCLAIQLRH